MRLKNYNEDLVLETVKIVLRDRPEIKSPTRAFMMDVAAYALNRIPPKYITSERGLTRELIQANNGSDSEEKEERLLNVIELITLVNRAVDVVVRRRRDSAPARPAHRAVPADDADLHLTYFYNMPHIFGRIVDSANGSPVISAQATLWINERVSVPAEPGWRNPYTTNEQTKGYFSFWPQVEMGETEAIRIELRIAFEHGRYSPFTFRKAMKVPGDFFVHDYIRGDKLMDIGTLPLQPS